MREAIDTARLFELTRSFKPDAAAFIRSIAPELDDEVLRKIASSDWGYDVEENLALLTAIRDSGRVSTFGSEDPHEVLSLCHWSELSLDAPRYKHLIRAFCSAALFQLAEKPECGTSQDTWLYFSYAQSAIALGYEQAYAALRSIAATIASPEDVPEIPNFGVAALALLAGSAPKLVGAADAVAELIAWVPRAPSQAPLDCSPTAAHRIDLSDPGHASDRCRWRELAQHVAAQAASARPSVGPNRIILPVSFHAPQPPLAKMLAEFADRIR